jgi:DNA polymerase IV (archaeal DinB-like DNA polymerase)
MGADVLLLQSRFGRWGIMMHELAWGRDVREPREDGGSRSVSREITFEEDTRDPDVLLGALDEMAGDLHAVLGMESLFFRTLTLKLRYTGFITKTWSRTLPHRTNSLQTIRDLARELLAAAPGGKSVRLIGIRLSALRERRPEQRSIEEYVPPDTEESGG